nr:immunoglobulin light chain junction region [Macaca mulatta]MOW71034.1 immunoglobulin light chain junction region [Macaca mulatta]
DYYCQSCDFSSHLLF